MRDNRRYSVRHRPPASSDAQWAGVVDASGLKTVSSSSNLGMIEASTWKISVKLPRLR